MGGNVFHNSYYSGCFGLRRIAGAATGIAKILFFVFLAVFVISLIFGRRPKV